MLFNHGIDGYNKRNYEDAFQNLTENKIIMAESQQFLQFNVRKRFTNG